MSTHYTAGAQRAADAARHRAVFNGASPAKSYHAAGIAQTVIVYALHHHVLHRASFTEPAEQTHILVICRNGQPHDGMAAAVEGAGVCVVVVCAYRRPAFACEVNVGVEGAIYRSVFLCGFVPCQ